MNDVTIQIPDDLERNCQVEIEAGDTLDNTTSFEVPSPHSKSASTVHARISRPTSAP
ncbi:MAG: hypothetical protein ACLTKG_08685 [Collinsella intestinalis]